MDIIKALAPAFAAGFAVQRLLEILDPIFDRWATERKKELLGIISLVVGFALAYYLELEILELLRGTPVAGLSLLDVAAGGLIISAGTEGFNAILKFLNYKKEEKKGDAVTKQAQANAKLGGGGTAGKRGVKAGALRSRVNLNMLRDPASRAAGASAKATGAAATKAENLEAKLEKELRLQIKNTWQQQFNEATWKEDAFSTYTDDENRARIVVGNATRAVAPAVDDDTLMNLQNEITLETTPEGALPLMVDAVLWS